MYIIFILTYARVRDVPLAANVGLSVFIELRGTGEGRAPETEQASGEGIERTGVREGARSGS